MCAAVWGTNAYVGDLHLTSRESLASHIMTLKNIFCYHGYHKNIFNVIIILILFLWRKAMGNKLTSLVTKLCNTSINKCLLSPLASDLYRLCHTDTVKCICVHACTHSWFSFINWPYWLGVRDINSLSSTRLAFGL